MVIFQTLRQRCRTIFASSEKRLVRYIIEHVFRSRLASPIGFGRLKLLMVRTARGLVDPTPTDAFLKHTIRDIQLNDTTDDLAISGQHFVESLGLRNRTWKAVEDETIAAIGLLNSVQNNPNNNVVCYQCAAVHCCFRFLAYSGAGSHGSTQHVTS